MSSSEDRSTESHVQIIRVKILENLYVYFKMDFSASFEFPLETSSLKLEQNVKSFVCVI